MDSAWSAKRWDPVRPHKVSYVACGQFHTKNEAGKLINIGIGASRLTLKGGSVGPLPRAVFHLLTADPRSVAVVLVQFIVHPQHELSHCLLHLLHRSRKRLQQLNKTQKSRFFGFKRNAK